MGSKTGFVGAIALAAGLVAGCSTGPGTKEENDALFKQAQNQRQEWNKIDPQLEAFAKKGEGFAFFPEIKKGGFVVGGADGRGVVYEKGQHIGYAGLSQVSVGFLAGAQTFSELIVFENQMAMDRFKQNEMNFGANASANLAESGTAMDARFVDGVAVFVKPTGGAMAEASLGGQKVTYMPK